GRRRERRWRRYWVSLPPMAAAAMVLGLAVWLAVLSGYDIVRRRLPNWLTVPGAVAIVTVAVEAGCGGAALAGAAALAGVYLIVHLGRPAAMGAGDVKLALGLGALTGSFGVQVWFLAALGAPLLTAGW